MDATAIILAAGEGTRMKSNHCKVSHKILGKPMVQWIVDATIKAGCSRVVVVIGSHADEMRALIGPDCMVRTAVHFRKEDPVDQAPALERAGQEAGSDRGALLAVQWYRGMD